jgi:hypothetical protein
MGGPKGPMRGPKTHRADQKLNRGERREPEPDYEAIRHNDEDRESKHQEQVRDEHPTRMTEAGYRSRHGNRR